jgi:L-asparaginase
MKMIAAFWIHALRKVRTHYQQRRANIKQQPAGIFVPFRNQHQLMQIHSGVRLASSLQLSGDFFSVQHKSMMQFENRQFSLLNPIKTRAQTTRYSLQPHFAERILMIRPYPNLNYDYFNLDQVDVILHDLYHSGTACTASTHGTAYSLVNFVQRCQEKGIKIYLAPAIKSTNAYDGVHALIQHGAEIIWNMALEAAYIKLLLAYGNFTNPHDISRFINTDIAGEFIEFVASAD